MKNMEKMTRMEALKYGAVAALMACSVVYSAAAACAACTDSGSQTVTTGGGSQSVGSADDYRTQVEMSGSIRVDGATVQRTTGSIQQQASTGSIQQQPWERGSPPSKRKQGGTGPIPQQPSGQVEVAEREVEVVADKVKALEVRGRNGAISVEATDMPDGKLTGTASIRCGGRDSAEAKSRASKVKITCKIVGGSTVISATFPAASSEEVSSYDGVGFTLATRALKKAKLDTSNGAVVYRGFKGECQVGTSNGSVAVTSHTGPITIDTSNGSVEVEQCDDAAPVKVDSSNGAINVVLRGKHSPMQLETSNGSIDASIPAGWEGTVQASTSNAAACIETPNERFVGEDGDNTVSFGNAKPLARIETSNGRIHVKAGFNR